MDKITGQAEITIQAPIEMVYEYLADFSRHPEWVKNVYKLMPLTPGPQGIGTKFRTIEFTPPTSLGRALAATWQYTLGVFKGVAPMSICEITALTTPTYIAWAGYLTQGKTGVFNRAEWELQLEPHGNATRVIQRFCYLPYTAGSRKMLAALGDGSGIAASCAVSLSKLKQILEQRPAAILQSA
ncbi:MAG: SRPBCC family protein [Anaerolineae bacterium]|nr:SRPBCC family protein [Anaerolineae bacterium]